MNDHQADRTFYCRRCGREKEVSIEWLRAHFKTLKYVTNIKRANIASDIKHLKCNQCGAKEAVLIWSLKPTATKKETTIKRVTYTESYKRRITKPFFSRLKQPGLVRLLDIRLNNVSQLAGYTKKNDLRFFLREICHIDYHHLPELAPTKEILDAYKKKGGDWPSYEEKFLALLAQRRVAETLDKEIISGGCLLCSEAKPDYCHRRLVAEYLRTKWGDVEIEHL